MAAARGDVIGVMIDGARIATPGLLHYALHGARLHRRAVVATLGWYLGFDFQGRSPHPESERDREGALLDSIAWPGDGYRLFEIGTMDESSIDGWFQPIAESNATFASRELWDAIGGFDERFDAAGGGLLNLDTFARLTKPRDAELVVLLGEATFHQWHGGTNTNSPAERQLENWNTWTQQYAAIRDRAYEVPRRERPPTFIGTLPPRALSRFVRAALQPASRAFAPPLGPGFNATLWTDAIPPRASDDAIARLIDLARAEFVEGRFEGSCAVARMIAEIAPEEPGIRDLLALVAPSVSVNGPDAAHLAEYHVALGEAHRILGRTERAMAEYRTALGFERDLPRAHVGLAALRMPGEDYTKVLERIYRAIRPETALEVGVYEGRSLALFEPPTIAIGIDPSAKLLVPPKTQTHLYAETSDEFFAQRRYETLLGARPLSVAFIDGLHIFEQALKDFIGVEALCGPGSVVLFHDTAPLDDETQRRVCDTTFHTGDVWKVVMCLKHFRPDLTIVTIATAPTGLTMVTGLDPTSRVLEQRYDEAVARFVDMPFSEIAGVAGSALNIVPNDWNYVRAYLEKSGAIA
jgi:tetratricopeptide (TPR) repeat protein